MPKARDVTFCTVCGGMDVQEVEWTRPNKGTIVMDGGPFIDSYFNAAGRGYTWCEDCGENTQLDYGPKGRSKAERRDRSL